jgi:hypothetical protein
MSGGLTNDLATDRDIRVADAAPALDRIGMDQGEEVRPLPAVGFWARLFGKRKSPPARNYDLEIYNSVIRQSKERRERAISLGFKLVYDPLTMMYAQGFDPHKEYQFLASTWETPQVFKLANVSPYFNISGLLYRPVPQ